MQIVKFIRRLGEKMDRSQLRSVGSCRESIFHSVYGFYSVYPSILLWVQRRTPNLAVLTWCRTQPPDRPRDLFVGSLQRRRPGNSDIDLGNVKPCYESPMPHCAVNGIRFNFCFFFLYEIELDDKPIAAYLNDFTFLVQFHCVDNCFSRAHIKQGLTVFLRSQRQRWNAQQRSSREYFIFLAEKRLDWWCRVRASAYLVHVDEID